MTTSRHADRSLPPSDGPWWFACDHPERPADEWIIWIYECDACTLALVAAAEAQPDRRVDERTHDHRIWLVTTILDTLAHVREWRAEHGHRPL